MKSKERRKKIIELLSSSDIAIAGKKLADTLGVSRQVIVQDIALLRAEGHDIISTTSGYVLEKNEAQRHTRVFKVCHTDEEVADELNLIVDYGGYVEDVFVSHKTYGTLSAAMGIHSRRDVELFVKNLENSKSSLLKNITSNYHYHTVTAPSEIVLNLIQAQLEKKGFLAKLQDYEPVDFWGNQDS